MYSDLPLKEEMHIHSLDGKLREAVILEKLGDNDYLAEYDGVRCHAIYNPFVDKFYVDDVYMVIEKTHRDSDDLRELSNSDHMGIDVFAENEPER